jgi:hypothetical protein
MRIRIVTEGASATLSPFRPPPIQFKLSFEL